LWRGREGFGGGGRVFEKNFSGGVAMLISLKTKAKRGWTDYYIQIDNEEQLLKVITHTIKAADYFEFCSRGEVELAKRIIPLLTPAERREVEKAIAVFETFEDWDLQLVLSS
jgi:hypothetical protein